MKHSPLKSMDRLLTEIYQQSSKQTHKRIKYLSIRVYIAKGKSKKEQLIIENLASEILEQHCEVITRDPRWPAGIELRIDTISDQCDPRK